MKRETAKRVLALLICVLMTASMLPTVAMAEEATDDTIDNSTETYTTYESEDDSDVTVPPATRPSSSRPATMKTALPRRAASPLKSPLSTGMTLLPWL